jgi:hypothetical protein
MSQQPYYDPDEATLAAARRIRIYRSLKYVPYVIIALLALGIYVGIKISKPFSTTIDTTQIPDRRYADMICGTQVRGISVPPNGYQLPTYCRVVISVNSGAVRIFQGEGKRTFDVGAGSRSIAFFVDRVYALEGWTNIDIIILRRGQDLYDPGDYIGPR